MNNLRKGAPHGYGLDRTNAFGWWYTKRMNLEPSKETGAEAINSIQHYFSENMPEPIGELAAVRRRVSVLAES